MPRHSQKCLPRWRSVRQEPKHLSPVVRINSVIEKKLRIYAATTLTSTDSVTTETIDFSCAAVSQHILESPARTKVTCAWRMCFQTEQVFFALRVGSFGNLVLNSSYPHRRGSLRTQECSLCLERGQDIGDLKRKSRDFIPNRYQEVFLYEDLLNRKGFFF